MQQMVRASADLWTMRTTRASRRWAKFEGYLFIAPWLLGFIIFVLGPFFASLYLSFTKWELLGSARWVGLQNYSRMFVSDPRFWISLRVTAYYTVLAIPLGMTVAFLLAMLLNQDVRGQAIYRTLYYLPSVTAGVATAILWIWLFNPEYGLINEFLRLFGIRGPGWITDPNWAIPGFALMHIWAVGGTMVIYLAGLQGVPEQLYEAASIDGAGRWMKIRYVTLPMMSSTIFFTLVMGVIGSFQTFTNALVMTDGGPADATLFYILYLYRNAFRYFNMGYASSLAWVLFIVVLILTLLQFRLSGRWVYYEGEERVRR